MNNSIFEIEGIKELSYEDQLATEGGMLWFAIGFIVGLAGTLYLTKDD